MTLQYLLRFLSSFRVRLKNVFRRSWLLKNLDLFYALNFWCHFLVRCCTNSVLQLYQLFVLHDLHENMFLLLSDLDALEVETKATRFSEVATNLAMLNFSG